MLRGLGMIWRFWSDMFAMCVPQIMIAQLLMSIDEHLFALWTLSLEQDMRITVCGIHK
jgi:hypothetical protein